MDVRPRSATLFVTFLSIAAAAVLAAEPVTEDQYQWRDNDFEQIAAPPPGTAQAELHEIRRLIAADRPAEADKLATRWINRHTGHELMPEAMLLRGDARAARKHYFRALYDYEQLVRAYPESEQFHEALEREFMIAKTFASGVKRRLWGMRIVPADGEAEELFILIQERAPGSRLAERAGKELGDFYYRRSEMALAAEAYDLFRQNYPRSQWSVHAVSRQIQANLATFRGPAYDATGLVEAQSRLSEFQEKMPVAAEQHGAAELSERVDESLAAKALVTARWYEKRGMRVSAVYMYRRVIDDYPGTVAAKEAAEALEKFSAALGPQAQPGDEADEQVSPDAEPASG